MKNDMIVKRKCTSKGYSGLRHLFLLIAMFFAAPGIFASGQSSKGKTFVVATNGLDSNPGSKSLLLATLEAARDAARKAEAGNNLIIVMGKKFF